MADKSIGVYDSIEGYDGTNNELVLEVGGSYISAIALDQQGKIAGFELYNCSAHEATNTESLINAIIWQSKILPLSFNRVKVLFNHPNSLLIPSEKFSKDVAAQYFKIVYGPDPFAGFHYNHIPISGDMMNVFTIPKTASAALHSRYENVTFYHVYSGFVRHAYNLSLRSPLLLSVQFYNKFFTLASFMDTRLQLVQTFTYNTAEDVSYHLLNLVKQLGLFTGEVDLQVSGLVDPGFIIYREIQKYFSNVSLCNLSDDLLIDDMKRFPLHYFTPFSNFAL